MATSFSHMQSDLTPQGDTGKYGYKFYPANLFNFNVATTQDQRLAATAESTSTTDNGLLVNINSTAMYGWTVAQGDVICTNFDVLPGDVDVAQTVDASVVFCASGGTVAQTQTFTVAYKQYDWVDNATNDVESPGTALGTPIAGKAELDTPYAMDKTAYGSIAASVLTAAGNGIQWEITATTIQTSVVTVFGL